MSSSDEGQAGMALSSSDEENAFYHRGLGSNRQRRKQRANDRATYGVFGEDDDDELEDPQATNKAGKFIGFVQGAALEDEEDGTDDGRGGLDYGGGGGLGIGARPGLGGAGRGAGPPGGRGDHDEDVDALQNMSSFGRRVRQQADKRRDEAYGKKDAAADIDTRGSRPQTALEQRRNQTVGRFEAHTKGIGAKLLGKMGWKQGQGLGKDGSGLAEPLQATLRPKGMGMGFGNRREPSLKSALDERKDDDVMGEKKTRKPGEQKEEELDIASEAKMWRKTGVDRRIREKKQIFKTVDEVLKSADKSTTKSAVQTIIDMRGPLQRVVQSDKLDAHSHAQDPEGPMPELQHNMRLLVDMTELEIKKVSARIRHSIDTKRLLEKEVMRLRREMEHAKAQRTTFKQAVDVMRALRHRVARALATPCSGSSWCPADDRETILDSLRKAFVDAKAGLGDDMYFEQNVHILAGVVVRRPIGEMICGWSPLQDMNSSVLSDSSALVAAFADWKPLLDRMDEVPDEDAPRPFQALVTDLVFPIISREIQATWNPIKDDKHCLDTFLESWKAVLPKSTVEYIAQHLVMPKLLSAAQQWDPLSDSLAPHIWLFPWLPYLGRLLDVQLWPMIRQKFSSALTNWHPSDPSALSIMAPWVHVFSSSDWRQLCATAIEPKLVRVLTAGGLTRFDHRDALGWVTAWSAVLGATRMAQLLDNHFFPRWRAELRRRLTVPEPNFPAIASWYSSWKQQLGECIDIDDERNVNLVSSLSLALEGMVEDMDRTLRGEELQCITEKQQEKPERRRLKVADRTPQSLKDLVAQFAEDSGVDFLPNFGKLHAGLQVWRFGMVPCVINVAREEILCLSKASGKWTHVSLDELLEENDMRLMQ